MHRVGPYSPIASALESEASVLRSTQISSELMGHYVDRQHALTWWELRTGEMSCS